MPKVLSKKSLTYLKITQYVNEGYSGNKISKMLRKDGLGVRNKALYQEIRSIKKTEVSKEKRKRSIPKKYREQKKISKAEPIGKIYRGSMIISSVPLHSRPFNRKYLGFRLNVFSHSKEQIRRSLAYMKNQFVSFVTDYLGSSIYAKEQTIGYEPPTQIYVNNPQKFDGTWIFSVEENGKTEKAKDGVI